MRIALILLSILAMIFIGSVSWSLVKEEGWNLEKSQTNNAEIDNIALETWKNQIKTEEKIEKLSAMVEELAKKSGTLPSTPPAGGESPKEEVKQIEAVKVSGKLLALLMPTFSLTLEENTGILGLLIFDQSIGYSTYRDSKNGLTVIPMNIPYDTFLKNTKALEGKPYSVNEVKTFPYRSFYMNPGTTDTLVRLVIEVESQTIALEIPKTKFNTLKDLLLGKSSQTFPKR